MKLHRKFYTLKTTTINTLFTLFFIAQTNTTQAKSFDMNVKQNSRSHTLEDQAGKKVKVDFEKLTITVDKQGMSYVLQAECTISNQTEKIISQIALVNMRLNNEVDVPFTIPNDKPLAAKSSNKITIKQPIEDFNKEGRNYDTLKSELENQEIEVTFVSRFPSSSTATKPSFLFLEDMPQNPESNKKKSNLATAVTTPKQR